MDAHKIVLHLKNFLLATCVTSASALVLIVICYDILLFCSGLQEGMLATCVTSASALVLIVICYDILLFCSALPEGI